MFLTTNCATSATVTNRVLRTIAPDGGSLSGALSAAAVALGAMLAVFGSATRDLLFESSGGGFGRFVVVTIASTSGNERERTEYDGNAEVLHVHLSGQCKKGSPKSHISRRRHKASYR